MTHLTVTNTTSINCHLSFHLSLRCHHPVSQTNNIKCWWCRLLSMLWWPSVPFYIPGFAVSYSTSVNIFMTHLTGLSLRYCCVSPCVCYINNSMIQRVHKQHIDCIIYIQYIRLINWDSSPVTNPLVKKTHLLQNLVSSLASLLPNSEEWTLRHFPDQMNIVWYSLIIISVHTKYTKKI